MHSKEKATEKPWFKITASIISIVAMVITGASYAFNPTINIDLGSFFSSSGNEQQLTMLNEVPAAQPTEAPVTLDTIDTTDVAAISQTTANSGNQSPPIVSVGSDNDEIIETESGDQPPPASGVGGTENATRNTFNASVVPDSNPVPATTNTVDIALITRNPESGRILSDACYVLVNYSNQGCDLNGDGQITFDDIPYGTYTVRQTVVPAGYEPASDFLIQVQPTAYSDGTLVEVPLGFVVRQDPVPNAPNTRNVSVVTVDAMTHQKVATDLCIEIDGQTNEQCDDGVADGQIDFMDVPAGGPYELKINLPAGYEIKSLDGPVGIYVRADESVPSNEIVFLLVGTSDETTGSATDQPPLDDPPVITEETAVLDVTLRACPEGIMPQNVNPAVDCTIPIDGSDPAGAYWSGDTPGHVLLSQSERLEVGSYRITVPAHLPISLKYLEPNLRDDYLAVGAHGEDEHGAPTITLIPNTTSNVTLYYYFYVQEAAAPEPVSEQAPVEVTIEAAEEQRVDGVQDQMQLEASTVRLVFRACPEGFDVSHGDFKTDCTTPLDAPDAAVISWGDNEWEEAPITSLIREWDGAYIFEADASVEKIEISGLEPSVRDGYKVFDTEDEVERDERDGNEDQEERFTIELTADDGETREIFVYYYFD